MNKINDFLKECYANYLNDIRLEMPEIPSKYIFPDGNPINPVMPTQLTPNKIMLIGAFPSARFEFRENLLIPVANNLSPFAQETYFDGQIKRSQASRESLDKNYFMQLGIVEEDLWITDIVKVYLYPEKHIKNCKIINPEINYVNTHSLFKKIAKAEANIKWIREEIEICNPKLIITLGEIPARVIRNEWKIPNKELLDGEIEILQLNKKYKIVHLGHPEIRRINSDWRNFIDEILPRLKLKIEQILSEKATE